MYTNQPLKEPTRSHGMQGGEEFEFETSSKGKKPEQYTQQVTQQENKNRGGAQRWPETAQGGQRWASGRDTIKGTVCERSNEEEQQWK